MGIVDGSVGGVTVIVITYYRVLGVSDIEGKKVYMGRHTNAPIKKAVQEGFSADLFTLRVLGNIRSTTIFGNVPP